MLSIEVDGGQPQLREPDSDDCESDGNGMEHGDQTYSSFSGPEKGHYKRRNL